MNTAQSFDRLLARYPYIAGVAYFIFIVVFFTTIWFAVTDLLEERAIVASSADILNQLDARRSSNDPAALAAGAIPAGSPFLGGDTITVAGAALLQRVGGAITRVGGSVQSSQVDVKGPKAKDGFITLVISCEVEQANLQKLLYDLEAGMPFLFIDQLIVQGPQESTVASNSRMRILVAVSGQWKGPN